MCSLFLRSLSSMSRQHATCGGSGGWAASDLCSPRSMVRHSNDCLTGAQSHNLYFVKCGFLPQHTAQQLIAVNA